MITIDSYQASDFPTIVKFVALIQEHERLYVPQLKTGSEIGDEYAKTIVDKASINGVILCARDNNIIVGFVCCWLEEDDDMLLRENARQHAYISDIFVDEKYRRQGVAQRLLENVEQMIKAKGCTRICVYTKASNRAALDCYEKNSYKQYEIILSKEI